MISDTLYLVVKSVVITPATIHVNAVIPAKAGIQNWRGCRIKARPGLDPGSGMTFDTFNCRSNKIRLTHKVLLHTLPPCEKAAPYQCH
jgi:hypothetical protein